MSDSTPGVENVEKVEGDVNIEQPSEKPAEETPAEGDTDGDEAQQDTGALQ